MSSLDVLILTPPGSADPSPAIAACRAGFRGFLDLEFTADESAALAAVGRLEHFTTTDFGIKVGRRCALLPRLADSSSRLKWVILAGGPHPELENQVKLLRRHNITIL